MTELSVRTNIARPTIYNALAYLKAVKDDRFYPPTYRLPEPEQV